MKTKRENLIKAFCDAIETCPEHYPKIMTHERFGSEMSTYGEVHTGNGSRFDCPSNRARVQAYLDYVTTRLDSLGLSANRAR